MTTQTVTAPVRTPALRLDGVSRVYGSGDRQVHALRNVNVQLRRGTFTAVMGPSGSGKSTFLHCAAGLDQPTSGQVWLGDVELSKLNETKLTVLRRERVGFIFQAYNLISSLTVRQNITLPLQLAGKRVDRATLDQVVRAVGLSGVDGGLVRARRKTGFRIRENGRVRVVRDDLTGRVVEISPELLTVLLSAGFIPVLSPPVWGGEGSLNVDADRLAAAVATALKAHTLVVLTDRPGVLTNDFFANLLSPGTRWTRAREATSSDNSAAPGPGSTNSPAPLEPDNTGKDLPSATSHPGSTRCHTLQTFALRATPPLVKKIHQAG
ncbi:ATP-binding cassette domain-containing protein [Kibdelosporangium lantanae]|uniref:ATP-binding cassette domain-containing protein n=1 Tax=Kibdelosporangium lantanae TaxID=1497396 RepID=A0ABW3M3N0_9PSEU